MKTLNDISSKNIYRERKASSDKKLYLLLMVIAVVVFISLATISTIGLITYKNISQKAGIIDSIDLGEGGKLKDFYNDTNTIRSQSSVETNSNTPKTTPNKAPTQETVPECYKYKIEIEGLESENCYKIDTFTSLVGVINEYNNTLYDIEAAQNSIDATCNNEYFAEECESSKNKLAVAQAQKNAKYNEIKEITASVN